MKKSTGITIFGIIFIFLAISIPLNPSTYIKPWTEKEAQTVISNITKEANVSLSDDVVEKLIYKHNLASPRFHYIHRMLLFILFVLYIMCALAILLRRRIIFKIIFCVFLIRIIYHFNQIFGFYLAYRIPFIVLSVPIPPIDLGLLYRVLYYVGGGILFSIFGIFYFTRHKVKEQLR